MLWCLFYRNVALSFVVAEEYVALSARQDGDSDRVERMRIYDNLWSKASAKIEVNYIKFEVLQWKSCIKIDK
jgi:hypothetical protein